MSKKDKGTQVELGQIPTSVGLRLQMPEEPSAQLLEDPSKLDEVVKIRITGVKKMHESIAAALVWKFTTVPLWLANQKTSEEREIAEETIAPRYEENCAFVDRALNHQEPMFKKAASVEYLNFQFSREFSDHRTASAMLQDLEKRQLFVQKEGGPIPIGRQRYDVPKEIGLKPKDIENIGGAVADFDRIFQQLTRDERLVKRKGLLREATKGYTLQDFLDGVPGLILLESPATLQQNGLWVGGGNLLLEMKNKQVLVIDSTGSIDENGTVPTMIEMDVRLPHYMLEWETPPSFPMVQKWAVDNLRLSEDQSNTHANKTRRLWYLVTGGIDYTIMKEGMHPLKEEYAKKANISLAQFYELDGNIPRYDGLSFLEFEGTFQYNHKPYYHVFLLMERSRDEQGVSFLEVLDAPKHVRELLGKLATAGKMEEGENFLRLPPELQKILRAIKGRVLLDAQLTNKVIQQV